MAVTKTCRLCKVEKPSSGFYERKDNQPGHRSECKCCWKIRTNAYTCANRPRLAHLHKMKNIEKKYGITRQEYAARLIKQNNKCAICDNIFIGLRGPKSPSVDHNHTTKKVRDLVCNGCNVAIGAIGENPKSLRAAADYLERHSG